MNRKRREPTREMKRQFAQWRKITQHYGNGDPFNEIHTIEMYEGIDDKPADLIIANDILEHLPEPEKALQEIKGLARKSVGFCILPDALRSRETWENMIGKYFPIAQTQAMPTGHIWIQCGAYNAFGLKQTVAAGTPEGRWENILSNLAAVSQRVHRAPVHDRKAIIACYGPSLGANLPALIYEAQAPDADVISVSGAHDFLIERGVIPKHHVECDPRPHKVENIATGHPDVEYLLGSVVNPNLIEKLKGHQIRLWHPSGCEGLEEIKDRREPNAIFIGGGANVGLRSLVLFYVLGYRRFSIYGMDCSFSDDGAQKWAGPHAQKKNPVDRQLIQVRVGDPVNGRLFTTEAVYLSYATQFFDSIKVMPDANFDVFGDSLLQAMSRQYMQQAEAA